MKRLSRPSHLMINTTAAHPQGKEKSMEKPKYRMDLDFLKQFDHCTNRYEPFDVVATSKGRPMIVMCSKKPDPAAWCIIGNLFSVHFLSYRDMENYMAQRGMEPWTEAHERTSGIHMMYL